MVNKKNRLINTLPHTQGFTESQYSLMHGCIRRTHGKATYCSNKDCKHIQAVKFTWALIRGRIYSKDVNDYIPLCYSCHKKYDDTPKIRHNLSKGHLGVNSHGHDRAVYKKSLKGKIIKEYPTLSEAARKNKILVTSINNCLKNRSETAGKFKWEYVNDKPNREYLTQLKNKKICQ